MNTNKRNEDLVTLYTNVEGRKAHLMDFKFEAWSEEHKASGEVAFLINKKCLRGRTSGFFTISTPRIIWAGMVK